MIYTKDYLIQVYLDRYMETCTVDELLLLEQNADKLYDEVGKDKFRVYASLDAQRLKEYND